MTVAGLAIDASNQCPIVLLRDPSGRRQVPIWIDHAQAHSIMAGIQKSGPIKPLSHDLMIGLIEAGKLTLERVIIHSIDENMFKAVLKLKEAFGKNNSEQNSDSFLELEASPSDAIALAVRAKCSIWMLENIVAETSIAVDAEADEADQTEFRRFLDQVSPSSLISHLKHNKSIEDEHFGLEGPNSNPKK